MASPTWLSILLGVIFNIKPLIAFATAYTAFWCGPFTPYLPLCLGITLTILKIIDKVKQRRTRKRKEEQDGTKQDLQ